MVRVLVAGILALLISFAIGPRFIRFLREREYGAHIREEGPKHHFAKQGTPTMGGLLIVASCAVAGSCCCSPPSPPSPATCSTVGTSRRVCTSP